MFTIKVPRAFVLHSLSECARRDCVRLKTMRKQKLGVPSAYVEDSIIRKANRILSVLSLKHSTNVL